MRNSGHEENRLPALDWRSRMANRLITWGNRKEETMALKEFAGVCYEDALDEKTRQLVAMAVMAAAGCTS